MSSEIDLFRSQLRAAGQPWSRRGVWSAGAGIVILALLQGVLLGAVRLPEPLMAIVLPLSAVSLVLIATGWVFLVMAILKRRRWAKARDLTMPALSEPSEGASK